MQIFLVWGHCYYHSKQCYVIFTNAYFCDVERLGQYYFKKTLRPPSKFLCCCLKNLDGIHVTHSHSSLKQNSKMSISEVMIQTRYRAQDSFAVYTRFRTCLFMLYLSTCMLHLNHRIQLAIPMHDLSQYLNLFVMASTCELQTNTLKTLNVMIWQFWLLLCQKTANESISAKVPGNNICSIPETLKLA